MHYKISVSWPCRDAGPSSSQAEQESDEEDSDDEDGNSENESSEEEVQDDYVADEDNEDADVGPSDTGQGSVSYVALSTFTGEEEGDLSVQVMKVKSAYFYRTVCIQL